jgi:hypothetical protein
MIVYTEHTTFGFCHREPPCSDQFFSLPLKAGEAVEPNYIQPGGFTLPQFSNFFGDTGTGVPLAFS